MLVEAPRVRETVAIQKVTTVIITRAVQTIMPRRAHPRKHPALHQPHRVAPNRALVIIKTALKRKSLSKVNGYFLIIIISEINVRNLGPTEQLIVTSIIKHEDGSPPTNIIKKEPTNNNPSSSSASGSGGGGGVASGSNPGSSSTSTVNSNDSNNNHDTNDNKNNSNPDEKDSANDNSITDDCELP